MALKIVRNDITKMVVDAIVNTANKEVKVGDGCDSAVYEAAGYEKLLWYRKENIGNVNEGDVFITPGFDLKAKNIIHVVSPRYFDGISGEEAKLRGCYKKALELAAENNIRSIAFPLISTGSFGYPKEEGLRIALDEINAFLLKKNMLVYITVFDEESVKLGQKVTPELEEFISNNYVKEADLKEYSGVLSGRAASEISDDLYFNRASTRLAAERYLANEPDGERRKNERRSLFSNIRRKESEPDVRKRESEPVFNNKENEVMLGCMPMEVCEDAAAPMDYDEMQDKIDNGLNERLKHLTDSFSEYLMYLIESKGMKNADVYNRSLVDKRTFSKIKSNSEAHPKKLTVLCLCVGARLNLDETKDLLARAGYALSPCDKTDVIFSFFIEQGYYDMIEISIRLEEYGLPCVVD